MAYSYLLCTIYIKCFHSDIRICCASVKQKTLFHQLGHFSQNMYSFELYESFLDLVSY